jgi:hypothetical protein
LSLDRASSGGYFGAQRTEDNGMAWTGTSGGKEAGMAVKVVTWKGASWLDGAGCHPAATAAD